jgi:2-C-methyl-D-erythritol 4-phosphate cytidylyltransferase
MKQSHNIALILAGGTGERMHAVVPKQFMEIDGESVILHTMRAFQHHPLIHEIYLVCTPEWESYARNEAKRGEIDKLSGIVRAGESGFASARNGIEYLAETITDPDAIVLVHDAVRPLITQDIISRNIAVCLTRGNAITALPSYEAYLVTSNGSTSDGFMPREGLMRAQTPHTFPLATLRQMLVQAKEQGIKESQSIFTLAGELGITPLHIAQGDLRNFKITEQSDILIYRALKALEE